MDNGKIKDSKPLKNLIQLEKSVASNYIRRLEDKILDFEEAILLIQKELTRWN